MFRQVTWADDKKSPCPLILWPLVQLLGPVPVALYFNHFVAK